MKASLQITRNYDKKTEYMIQTEMRTSRDWFSVFTDLGRGLCPAVNLITMNQWTNWREHDENECNNF